MGTTIRTTLVAFAATALLAGGVTPPAVAGAGQTGKHCTEESNAVKRCAEITHGGSSFTAKAYVWQSGDRTPGMLYQMRVLLFQRQTDDGWTTVKRKQVSGWFESSDGQEWTEECSDIGRGVYRTKAKARWKVGADGDVTSRWIASSGLGKRRFC